jgi:phosphatase NudJ
MNTTRWKPNVTVAAIIEQDGRFLLVEEETPDGLRLNNPAGHLEPGESLLDAVIRETREETTRDFSPAGLIGIYLMKTSLPETFLRFAFKGTIGPEVSSRALDAGILRTVWMTPEEIRLNSARLRSPLVIQCLDDHLAGHHFSTDMLHHVLSENKLHP